MPETGSVRGESVHLRVILPLVNSTIDKEESMPGPDYAWEESVYLRFIIPLGSFDTEESVIT